MKTITIEQLKEKLGKSERVLDIKELLDNFLRKQDIDRITRIRDIELDNIARLFFFGIRHTALLNKNNTFSYIEFEYKNLEISNILEFVLINLGLRLSLNSKSREELQNIISSLVRVELEKLEKKENADKSNN